MNNIRKARVAKGISQKEVAITLGVSRPTVSEWENGKKNPNNKNLRELAKLLCSSTDYLLGNTDVSSTPAPSVPGAKWVPVLGKVQAGTPVEAIEDILDYEELTPKMAKEGEHFALQVRGDSMLPQFREGDVVIVRKQSDVESGDIAVILVNGEDATIKKFIKLENGVSLVATNSTFDPIFFSEDKVKSLPITVLGKVIELRAKF